MMNQTLEATLFDYVNYPTVKCPAIVKKSTEQVVPQPIAKTQEKVAPLQLSIQEPYYSVFAWEPVLAFLAIFLPLFLSVLINADGIIYIFVALMGKLLRAQ
jgi:ATP adenylyltransferase/5',5'''-P-1,P-4-tetraphosphate phosphorylase II